VRPPATRSTAAGFDGELQDAVSSTKAVPIAKPIHLELSGDPTFIGILRSFRIRRRRRMRRSLTIVVDGRD
jgi:hypothetical protein